MLRLRVGLSDREAYFKTHVIFFNFFGGGGLNPVLDIHIYIYIYTYSSKKDEILAIKKEGKEKHVCRFVFFFLVGSYCVCGILHWFIVNI